MSTEMSAEDTSTNLSALVDAIQRSEAVIKFKPDGTIIEANDNFLNAMGYRLQEIAGRHHRMFCDADYARSADYQRHWAALQAGEFIAGEFQRFNKAGDDVWIRASYNPIFDPSGRVTAVVKIARDITASKQVALGIEAALKKLAEADFEQVSQKAMSRIEESSSQIARTADIIEEIARRTQLLGLNAEIEASQAGVHGRGFSVVAREIRKLALQSEESVDQIRKLTRGASETVSESGREIERCTEDIRSIVERVAATQQALSDLETADATGRSAAQRALETALRDIETVATAQAA